MTDLMHVNELIIPSYSRRYESVKDGREKVSVDDDDYVDVDDKDNKNNNHNIEDDIDNDFVAILKIFTAKKQ